MKKSAGLIKLLVVLFIVSCCSFSGLANANPELNQESKDSDEKIEKMELQIRELKVELLQLYTFRESLELGAKNYTDPHARNTCKRQLDKMDKKTQKLIDKIKKKQDKLDALAE